MRLVHRTAALQIAGGLARVNPVAMNAALEEARTAWNKNKQTHTHSQLLSNVHVRDNCVPRTVTTVNPIMLSRAAIAAHFARYVQQTVACKRNETVTKRTHRTRVMC